MIVLPSVPQASEEKKVEELLDRAAYLYGLVEDYKRALIYLDEVLGLTKSSYYKSQALVKKAYVYFLMGKTVRYYIKYIAEALENNPSLELEELHYKERFKKIFSAIKKSPEKDTQEVSRTITLPPSKRSRGGGLFLSVNFNYLSAADENYKKIYQSGSFFPSFKAGFRLDKNIYIWAGFGSMSSNGTIPEMNVDAKAKKQFFSLGLRYSKLLPKKLGYKLEAGVVSAKYSEEALGLLVEESTKGISLEGGLLYSLSSKFFLEFSVGYLSVADDVERENVKLGGFIGGLGAGVRL
jgi:hypothetical protein